jgi:hypothetical protein
MTLGFLVQDTVLYAHNRVNGKNHDFTTARRTDFQEGFSITALPITGRATIAGEGAALNFDLKDAILEGHHVKAPEGLALHIVATGQQRHFRRI